MEEQKEQEQTKNNFELAAEEIKKSMSGYGTDEESLIRITTSFNNKERLKIKKIYKKKYNKDLINHLKSETSGKFEDALIALYSEPVEYDAECLNKAMGGFGTDEDTLIEIIASRPDWLLKKIKSKYIELYQKTLEEDIKGDVSGEFLTLLIGILNCQRNTNKNIVNEDCQKIANELKDSDWEINNEDNIFYKYIILSSPQELSFIAKEYYKLTGKTIIDEIEKKYSGDIKKLLKSIIYSQISPSEYFATRIKEAIECFGTDNKSLIRILVTRCEVYMPIIKKYYNQLYQKDMIKDIKDDTSGDYQKLMLELIK